MNCTIIHALFGDVCDGDNIAKRMVGGGGVCVCAVVVVAVVGGLFLVYMMVAVVFTLAYIPPNIVLYV